RSALGSDGRPGPSHPDAPGTHHAPGPGCLTRRCPVSRTGDARHGHHCSGRPRPRALRRCAARAVVERTSGPLLGCLEPGQCLVERAMSLRNRLFLLVSAVVLLTVALVTLTFSASARQSFATLDAERTAALVEQFRREFADQGLQVAERVDRLAQSEAVSRIAASRDVAPYVNEATTLAVAQGLDVLDIVAADGTIVSSAEWPARFGYRNGWITNGRTADAPAAFLQAIELPETTTLALVAIRTLAAGAGNLYIAAGRRLDRKFLQSLVLAPGMRVLLYQNLQPEISSRGLLAGKDDPLEAAPLEPLIARVIHNRQEAKETIEWPDGPETVDALPLTGRDGSV